MVSLPKQISHDELLRLAKQVMGPDVSVTRATEGAGTWVVQVLVGRRVAVVGSGRTRRQAYEKTRLALHGVRREAAQL